MAFWDYFYYLPANKVYLQVPKGGKQLSWLFASHNHRFAHKRELVGAICMDNSLGVTIIQAFAVWEDNQVGVWYKKDRTVLRTIPGTSKEEVTRRAALEKEYFFQYPGRWPTVGEDLCALAHKIKQDQTYTTPAEVEINGEKQLRQAPHSMETVLNGLKKDFKQERPVTIDGPLSIKVIAPAELPRKKVVFGSKVWKRVVRDSRGRVISRASDDLKTRVVHTGGTANKADNPALRGFEGIRPIPGRSGGLDTSRYPDAQNEDIERASGKVPVKRVVAREGKAPTKLDYAIREAKENIIAHLKGKVPEAELARCLNAAETKLRDAHEAKLAKARANRAKRVGTDTQKTQPKVKAIVIKRNA